MLTSHNRISPDSINILLYSRTMNSQPSENKPKSIWDKMVHASFRKVVAFDLLFMGLGIAIGVGIGAFIVY